MKTNIFFKILKNNTKHLTWKWNENLKRHKFKIILPKILKQIYFLNILSILKIEQMKIKKTQGQNYLSENY